MVDRAGEPGFTGPVPDPPPIPWRLLLLVLLIALGLRALCSARTEIIGTDSARFLAAAHCVEDGDLAGAIADPYHPLTAVLIGSLNSVQNAVLGEPEDHTTDRVRRERAGIALSLVFGMLTVWVAMDLTRRLFPGVSPVGVGLLVAMQPYFVRASVDIMSDAIHLCFFALALRSGVIALTGARWGPFAWTGLFIGLGYLTRPEALVLVPAIGGVWLVLRPWGWRRFLPRVSLALTATAVCVVPYAVAIGGRLTGKKDVGEMIGVGGEGSVGGGAVLASADAPLVLASAVSVFTEWYSTMTEALGGFALLGIALRLRRSPRAVGDLSSGFVAFGMVAVLILLLVQLQQPDYLSRRHVFVLVFLALPYACHFLAEFAPWLARILPRRIRAASFALLLAGFAAGLVYKSVDPHRADQRMQRVAAQYILDHGGAGQRIYTSREKVAYYAGGDLEPLTPGYAEQLVHRVAGQERAWIAFYRERFGVSSEEIDALLESLGPGLRRVGNWAEPASRRPRHLELYLYERPVPLGTD